MYSSTQPHCRRLELDPVFSLTVMGYGRPEVTWPICCLSGVGNSLYFQTVCRGWGSCGGQTARGASPASRRGALSGPRPVSHDPEGLCIRTWPTEGTCRPNGKKSLQLSLESRAKPMISCCQPDCLFQGACEG